MTRKIKQFIYKIINRTDTVRYIVTRVWSFYIQCKYCIFCRSRYPVDNHLIIFESFRGRQYSCNPRALYETLCADPRYRDYRKIWVFKEPENYRFLEKDPNTRLVTYKSKEYFQAYARAKVWVSNFRLINNLAPRKNQIYVQTWHGTPLKRIGCDIEGYSGYTGGRRELEFRYTSDACRYRYVLAPSPFYREKITSAFRLDKCAPRARFINGGYPRNDFLLNLTEKKIAALKEQLDIPEEKKVILYAPTWRETEHIPEQGYRYRLAVDFGKWRRTLGEDVLILYRSHYLVGNAIDLTPYEGFVKNVSSYDDINDLYAVSDLLITDYSSVFFDYANMERPMIFYMYDFEEYKNDIRGFYIDVAELPGPIVKEEDELLKLLKDYDGEGYEEIYRKFNEKYNPYRQGNGAAIVWRTVLRQRS